MKMKMKFDQAALKEFFLLHVEKIVFSLVILCFLLFVFGAVKGESWNSRPEDLSNLAKNAVKRINETPPEKGLKVVIPYSRPVPDPWAKIPSQDVALYGLPTPYMPLPPGQGVRERPDVLPLEQPRAAAGTGAFTAQELTVNPTQPSGPNRGQRWVVVSGLLPFGKQREIYAASLRGPEGMRNPANPMNVPDIPVWIYYNVERAEVSSDDQDVASLDWKPLNPARAWFSALRRWRGASREVVAPKFLHALGGFPMAFPLGPLVNASWGPEVAHEPDIPVAAQDQMGAYGMPMMPGAEAGMVPGGPAAGKPAKDKGKKPPEKSPAVKAQEEMIKKAMEKYLKAESEVPNEPPVLGPGMPTMPAPGMMPGAMPGMPGMSADPAMMGGAAMPVPGMDMPGGAGAPMMPGFGMDPAMMGAGGMTPMPLGEIVSYQLFRFFDFGVEQGKRYRYRVRLVLKNPNCKVDTQYLADEKEARIETLESEWSSPTDATFVPRDARILASEVNVPRDPYVEPWAKFGVVRFDMESGEIQFKSFPNKDVPLTKMLRGQLANFRDLPRPAPKNPAFAGYGGAGLPEAAGMGMPGVGAPKKSDSETMDLLTDYALLDMNGGTKLPGRARLSEPGRMLWLDPAGKMIVRNDVDDEEEYAEFAETETKAKPAAPPVGVPGLGMPADPAMMGGAAMPGMPADPMLGGAAMPVDGAGMPADIFGMPGAGRPKPGAKPKRRRPTE